MKVATGIALMLAIALFLPLASEAKALEGLDPGLVRLGLALFVGIAFLWMTEALPLAITALLVPVIAAVHGEGFANARVMDLSTLKAAA